MENCATNLAIHQGMGTTQEERFIAALKTNYFFIDERKDIDYIEFVQKLAPYIKFFNESNTENGDWSTFFEWESTSILVHLFLWDLTKIQEDYKVVKETIKLLQNPDENVVQEAGKLELDSFFKKIKEQFEKIYSKIAQLDEAIVAKSILLDTAYLIENPLSSPSDKSTWGILQLILDDINSSTVSENPIKSLISKYQFDKNVQRLLGLLSNWIQLSGESVANQLTTYSSHTPHYALFLAFLKQLGVAQEHLNQFTKRHLDFYYKDILRVKPAAASPDYVHLLLESAVQTNGLSLPKDSIFQAGKNSLGKAKFYASTSELAINAIKLNYFSSTFFTAENERSQSDFMKINGTNTPFNVFESESVATQTGILVASPLLFLGGGDRYLRLTIKGVEIDTSKYRFYITGEKKCIEIFADYVIAENISNSKETVKIKYLVIGANEKKIIAHDPKIHKEIQVTTSYPVLKIVPKEDEDKIEVIDNLTLEVKVRNCKNFVVTTDTGTVDINKPFVPFGEFPKNGNGFVICCNEFACKNNARLFLKINNSSTDDNFNDLGLKILKLDGGLWEKANDIEESILNGIINTNPILNYASEDSIPTITSVSGYYRIELDGGATYKDEAFLNDFIQKSRTGGTLQAVPRIDSLVIDYDVSDTICNSSLYNSIDVFQIMPFGYQQINVKEENSTNCSLIPFAKLVESGGEIYLGFDNVAIGNSLNLLVQLAEGSSNPLKDPALLEWYFLENKNVWKKIESNTINDETDGLIQSGLIDYTIPKFDTSQTTILPATTFWIKIIVDQTDAICEFIGVHTQAFKAVLTDFQNNGSDYIEPTEKETISKLYQPLSFVKKITQPYGSFGGKVKEDDNLVYQRTSERLRHKNRAITLWDYERLVLQEFPNVYRVKCLNHYRYDSVPPSKVSAGYCTLIPIEKSNRLQENVTWKPLVSQATMNKIRKFVSEIGSPHARVMVKQPKLETIVLTFKVKYHEIPSADLRLYESKLKAAINTYLSPWAFEQKEVQFANSVEIASIIQLIDDQTFVDFITDFEVTQYYTDENGVLGILSNVKKIVPYTDYTLFVPPSLFSFPKDKNSGLKTILKDHTISQLTDTYC